MEDVITFDARAEITIALHKGLKPKLQTPGKITLVNSLQQAVPIEIFKINLPQVQTSLQLAYGGEIHHPLEVAPLDKLQGEMQSAGIISDDGVFLAASSAWFPRVIDTDQRVNFALTVEVPINWSVVSQGERLAINRSANRLSYLWEERSPQYDIYIIAAPFTEYWSSSERISTAVFLRQPDAPLAERYLGAADRYLKFYSSLLGAYPYTKFALVENFWQTGYGMPSFTLIGSMVIRLPFVIDTSFPHEIVHNWWGNGVIVDDEGGNWSEGLTSYLADHLIQEQRGNGAEYRRTALQKYADYAATNTVFPLQAFKGRESRASESIGYGKGLMFFHMLRRSVGDTEFVAGLRAFYAKYNHKLARFNDFKGMFSVHTVETRADFLKHRATMDAANAANIDAEQHSLPLLELVGENEYFDQWLRLPGAPELRLDEAEVSGNPGAFQLKITVSQHQKEAPYVLDIPVAVTLEDGEVI
ncbi:MAG: M1 family aminopeptidase, partial [Gammaproteobacteria bacterium]|nr:M1 family aminopeptidase [Gammaproteobacteria bacterium]